MTVIAVLLVSLAISATTFMNQIACEGQPINASIKPTVEQQIRNARVIGQTFVAPRDQLNRIEILLQTYQRRNTGDVTLRLLELASQTESPLQGLEVYRSIFNAAEVKDNAWYTFSFSPLDSAGKTFLIALSSPDSEDGNAITVGGIQQDAYTSGSAYLGPTPIVADITFRACFQMTNLEKLQVLADQLTHARPGVWGKIAFYLWLLGAYIAALVILFSKLIRDAK